MPSSIATPVSGGKEHLVSQQIFLAHFNRYLWDAHDLLVITGDSKTIGEGRAAYNTRYGIQLSGPKHEAQLERMMAAASLAAVSLADRESWGWSTTLKGTNVGFFCAVEPEGLVCGQVRPAESRLAKSVVQRRKPEEALKQSTYEPEGQDPVGAVQAYFEKVDQISTRISITLDGRGVLVQTLPGGSLEHMANASDDQLVEHIQRSIDDGELKHLDEVLLFYECRCSDEMILSLLVDLPADQRAELWKDTEQLEVDCPRCGREYVLRKAQAMPESAVPETGSVVPEPDAQ